MTAAIIFGIRVHNEITPDIVGTFSGTVTVDGFPWAKDSYNISEVFLRNLCGETEIFSNMPLNGAEKIRNGMVYCRNENLKNKEFYMNIALD